MGNRSYFDGGLFSYIGWIILGSLITSGIYSFFVHIKLERWRVKNTTFLN
nr:hypothetical protein [uncultured Leptotrichia sp.]